jgi:hypothetical protein
MKRRSIGADNRTMVPTVRKIGGILLALAALQPLPGQQIDVQSTSVVDWRDGALEMTLSVPRIVRERNAPAASFYAQRVLEERYVPLLVDQLRAIPVDSVMTIRDHIENDPRIAARLVRAAENANRGVPFASEDLTRLRRRYTIPIYPDIADLFVAHDVAFPLNEVIAWTPTRAYTGVVIYAADPIPLRGTNRFVRVRPAILPEIYDEEFRPVLEHDMVDPEWIRRWGVVGYTDHFDETQWRERVGSSPMRIMALQAFGVHPSDIIIEREDADRLLALEHNRDILREGRVVVIVGGSAIETHAD